MANSDGGLIFYGIDEVEHVASAISFIDGDLLSKEWIENVLSSGIQRKIDGLAIYPVRFDDDMLKSVYVVKIPSSANAPHQARDNRYYKRYNFQAAPMEEYEVRNTYLRRQQTKLEIYSLYYTCQSLERLIQAGPAYLSFSIRLQIINTGTFPAELYKALITLPIHEAFGISNNQGIQVTHLEKNWQISSLQSAALFPGEVSNVMSFDMTIEYFGFSLKEEELKFEVKLYYPGGEQKDTVDLTNAINKLYEQVWDAHHGKKS